MEEIARGEEAKRIINSQVFKDALEQIKGEAYKQLDKSPIVGDSATVHQQQLIMLLKVSNKFVKLFEDTIMTGKLAAEQIQQEKRGMFK
ncbi:MAG: hypothetical protein GTN99_07080 [Candidatus Dadabacteria bacterium]|nr:hypothetical protein [Candidatus Dadabacteria bacterium]